MRNIIRLSTFLFLTVFLLKCSQHEKDYSNVEYFTLLGERIFYVEKSKDLFHIYEYGHDKSRSLGLSTVPMSLIEIGDEICSVQIPANGNVEVYDETGQILFSKRGVILAGDSKNIILRVESYEQGYNDKDLYSYPSGETVFGVDGWQNIGDSLLLLQKGDNAVLYDYSFNKLDAYYHHQNTPNADQPIMTIEDSLLKVFTVHNPNSEGANLTGVFQDSPLPLLLYRLQDTLFLYSAEDELLDKSILESESPNVVKFKGVPRIGFYNEYGVVDIPNSDIKILKQFILKDGKVVSILDNSGETFIEAGKKTLKIDEYSGKGHMSEQGLFVVTIGDEAILLNEGLMEVFRTTGGILQAYAMEHEIFIFYFDKNIVKHVIEVKNPEPS